MIKKKKKAAEQSLQFDAKKVTIYYHTQTFIEEKKELSIIPAT